MMSRNEEFLVFKDKNVSYEIFFYRKIIVPRPYFSLLI